MPKVGTVVVVPHVLQRPGGLNSRPHIILVDRQPLFLAALAEVIVGLRPLASIGRTTDSALAIEIVSRQPTDVILCEARSEPLTGPELAARLRTLDHRALVILLGDPEDATLLIASFGCGATGFLTKDVAPEELLEAIDAVLAGHYVIGRELLHPALERLAGQFEGKHGTKLEQLSAAERSILTLVGRAQTTRAIAASRGISQKTVRNHLASIYRKLELRNRSEAILWSARAGLTELAVESRP
jgi:DNA-binding NarL/FixJ family response regulator